MSQALVSPSTISVTSDVVHDPSRPACPQGRRHPTQPRRLDDAHVAPPRAVCTTRSPPEPCPTTLPYFPFGLDNSWACPHPYFDARPRRSLPRDLSRAGPTHCTAAVMQSDCSRPFSRSQEPRSDCPQSPDHPLVARKVAGSSLVGHPRVFPSTLPRPWCTPCTPCLSSASPRLPRYATRCLRPLPRAPVSLLGDLDLFVYLTFRRSSWVSRSSCQPLSQRSRP